jgi:hypothetical protein
VIISVYRRVSGEKPRRKYRQWRSVQSIMGATDTLRDTEFARVSSKTACSAGFSLNGVPGSLMRIWWSLSFAEETKRRQDQSTSFLSPPIFSPFNTRATNRRRPSILQHSRPGALLLPRRRESVIWASDFLTKSRQVTDRSSVSSFRDSNGCFDLVAATRIRRTSQD